MLEFIEVFCVFITFIFIKHVIYPLERKILPNYFLIF